MLKKILILFAIGCFCSDLNAIEISSVDNIVPGSREIVYKVTNESNRKIDVQLRIEKCENNSRRETDEVWIKSSSSFKVDSKETELVKVSFSGLESNKKPQKFLLIVTSSNEKPKEIIINSADIETLCKDTCKLH